jgi:hypothetical protein
VVSIVLDNFGPSFLVLTHKWWLLQDFFQTTLMLSFFPAIVHGKIVYSQPMTGALSGVSSQLSVSSRFHPRRFSGHPCVPAWICLRLVFHTGSLRRWVWTSDAALKYYRSEEDVVASVRQALGACLDQP